MNNDFLGELIIERTVKNSYFPELLRNAVEKLKAKGSIKSPGGKYHGKEVSTEADDFRRTNSCEDEARSRKGWRR